MNVLIPMAGEGSRFKMNGYELPKPLISVDGEPMICKALKNLPTNANYYFVTRKYENEYNNKHLEETLNKLRPGCKIIQIDYLTNGSSETCLLAKDFIDNDDPLIITNCDQLIEWNFQEFFDFVENNSMDGSVVTYESTDPKNSFALVTPEGNITKIAEKDPISSVALIGLHYWRRGKDFVSSASKAIGLKDRGNGEYYVGPTYNYLIKDGMVIKNYAIKKNTYIPLGTPEDLNIYISRTKEFKEDKNKTIICDLDGTILKHVHGYDKLNSKPTLLPGVLKKFVEWDSIGHTIILMSARKESARKLTEKFLEELMVPYDMLILNVTSGRRVLINDKITPDSFDRANSVNLITDEGFDNTNWERLGL